MANMPSPPFLVMLIGVLALFSIVASGSIYNPQNLNIDSLPVHYSEEGQFFSNVLIVAQNQTTAIDTYDVLDEAFTTLNAQLANETRMANQVCNSTCSELRDNFRSEAFNIYLAQGQDSSRLMEESLFFIKLFNVPSQLVQATVNNATRFISLKLCSTATVSTSTQEKYVQSLKLLTDADAKSSSTLRAETRQYVGDAFNCYIARILAAYPNADYSFELGTSFAVQLKRFTDASSIRSTFLSIPSLTVKIPDSIPSTAKSILVWRSPVNPHSQGGESRAHVSVQFRDAKNNVLVLRRLSSNLEITYAGDFIQWDYSKKERRPTENICSYWSSTSWHSGDCWLKEESTSLLTCACSRSGEFAVFEKKIDDHSWVLILGFSIALGVLSITVLAIILITYCVHTVTQKQEERFHKKILDEDMKPSTPEKIVSLIRLLGQQLW
eukprot:CAMPEP_0117451422 /NCGR_PEP_ID=MMETSP0759-20121206/8997_1 /TAXON_ID=63605 /ORGANISM="Percolomonas cosmopolitus, Strain WS" /LENGTH=438 /DNA_ID=CAMNT_0005244017 /DNA_START=35 /DNA_END=1348 /DNA_ORIENTATION=+